MTAAIRWEGVGGYMVLFVTAVTLYKNPPPTLYIMALYQGYIQVVSAVG